MIFDSVVALAGLDVPLERVEVFEGMSRGEGDYAAQMQP